MPEQVEPGALRVLGFAQRFLSRLSGGVAAAVILAMALLITAATVGRYTGWLRVKGAHEIAGYLQIVLVYGALAAAFARGQFIRVEVLIDRLKGRALYALEIVNHLLALAVVIALTATNWQMAMAAFERGTRSVGELRTQLYPFLGLIVVGMALLAMQIAISLLIHLLRGPKRAIAHDVEV